MKLKILFFTLVMLQATLKATSQQITFSGKDISLEKVLEAVKQQSGYEVFFNSSILKESKPVTIRASNMPLVAFLDEVFKDEPLKYTIQNKNIIVSRKLPVGTATEDAPKPVTLTGRVTDSSGNPLTGATIAVRGQLKNTISDQQGTFTLEVVPGDVLVV